MFLNTAKKYIYPDSFKSWTAHLITGTVRWSGSYFPSLPSETMATKDRKCGWFGMPPGPGASRLGGAGSGLPPEFAWCIGHFLCPESEVVPSRSYDYLWPRDPWSRSCGTQFDPPIRDEPGPGGVPAQPHLRSFVCIISVVCRHFWWQQREVTPRSSHSASDQVSSPAHETVWVNILFSSV